MHKTTDEPKRTKRLTISDLSNVKITTPQAIAEETNNSLSNNISDSLPPEEINLLQEAHADSNYNKDRIVKLLLQQKSYTNARQPVLIAEELKEKLDALSRLTNLSISNIVNNALSIFLGNDAAYSINTELRDIVSKQKTNLFKNL